MEGGRQFSDNKIRKRKASTQDNNERLSKRLSRLDICTLLLEKIYKVISFINGIAAHSGRKLYDRKDVQLPASSEASATKSGASMPTTVMDDDTMRLDNTKDKVYIYNLDDELSSSDDEAVEKVRFHPDLEKHLRNNKIPASVLANSDGELAGVNHAEAQLVLYGVPKSLTVPEGQVDSVRKAIIETRARARGAKEAEALKAENGDVPTRDESIKSPVSQERSPKLLRTLFNSTDDDPDAMEID